MELVQQVITIQVELKEEKYYDLYQYNTWNRDFTPRILGDATGENAVNKSGTGWSKSQWFASTNIPVFCRGSKSTELYGLFAFGNNAGQAWLGYSFRIVLAP